MKLAIFATTVLFFSSLKLASAASIVAGTDLVPAEAIQQIDLFAGTPLNPTANTLTITLDAAGNFVLDRQAQVGNTITFTLQSASFFGVLPGPLPPLGFHLQAGTPELNPSSGQITSIVQNPADPGFAAGAQSSFVSGHFSQNTFFDLLVPALGATIYSDPATAVVFSADLTGLPPPAGTVFASADRVNLYLELGPGFDTTRDLLVGQSYDRTVTVTPEPSSILILLSGAVTAAACVIRRRRTATA